MCSRKETRIETMSEAFKYPTYQIGKLTRIALPLKF